MKIIRLTSLFLALALLSDCALKPGLFDISGPVRVAGVFDLTRRLASLDGPASRGAQLAAEEVNRQGGLAGSELEFIVRDTTSTARKIQGNVESLIQYEKVSAFIGFSDTDQVIAADPIVQAANLPFISVGATSPRLTGGFGSGKTLLLAAFGDNAQAAVAAEFAKAQFGPRAIIIYENTKDYPVLLSRYFKKRFEELGGEVIGSYYYVGNPPRLVPITRQLKGPLAKPDVVFVASMPVNTGYVIRQLRAAGIKAPIIGGDSFDSDELRQSSSLQIGQVYFTTHAWIHPSNPSQRVQDFIAKYRARFNVEPENSFAALGYDAVMLFTEGARRAGSLECEKIIPSIQSLENFEGVTGPFIYGANRRVPFKKVSIVGLGASGLEFISEQMPEKMPVP